MEIVAGVLFHAVGASCASLCYTPQKKVTYWSWQTYWLLQAFVCWLLLPLLIAWLTIPQLFTVLAEAPSKAMYNTFMLGMAYGIGGTAFGIAIKYAGFSLTYAISVGISCVLGTLLPPLVRGHLASILQQQGWQWVLCGMALGVAGIALCGFAGRYKERDMQGRNAETSFSLARGLPLCVLAGVLSALYGFSIDQGQPIAQVAAKYGGGYFQSNAIYIFSNSGAFITTLLYCLYLHKKQHTFNQYLVAGNSKKPFSLRLNFLLASLTGLLWYAQFFFYGLAHVRMGNYKFTSWAIHMIMLVLLSSVAGLLMKEWSASSVKTKRTLWAALVVLISSVLLLTYGNYLAGA